MNILPRYISFDLAISSSDCHYYYLSATKVQVCSAFVPPQRIPFWDSVLKVGLYFNQLDLTTCVNQYSQRGGGLEASYHD